MSTIFSHSGLFKLAYELPEDRLVRLVRKFIPLDKKIINKNLAQWINLTDEEIYSKLINLRNNETESVSDDEKKEHKKSKPSKSKKPNINKKIPYKYKERWEVIRNSIKKVNIGVTRYLDYGCGECDITEFLGKKLNLKKVNILAVDIEGWMGELYDKPKSKQITFTQIKLDGKLPYKTKSISLITLFQVFHHIPDMNQSFVEINRVLKPGGIIIIREHNCDEDNKKLEALINIEHGIWDVIVREMPYKTFVTQHYAKYYPIEFWKQFLSYNNKNQFIFEKIDSKSITKYFYLAYKKC